MLGSSVKAMTSSWKTYARPMGPRSTVSRSVVAGWPTVTWSSWRTRPCSSDGRADAADLPPCRQGCVPDRALPVRRPGGPGGGDRRVRAQGRAAPGPRLHAATRRPTRPGSVPPPTAARAGHHRRERPAHDPAEGVDHPGQSGNVRPGGCGQLRVERPRPHLSQGRLLLAGRSRLHQRHLFESLSGVDAHGDRARRRHPHGQGHPGAPPLMPLNRGAMTDMGRMRKNNEDRYLIAGRLAAVADGMGGHRAGEVASAIAMEELATLEHAGPWPTPAEAGEALRRVFLAANRRIRETAAKDSQFEGMGTTLVALLEDGDSIHLANVGDSRAYLLRNGELSQVTIDHTLVQELIDEGRLRPEEAERHPQRSIITRALGVEADVEVDLFTYQLQRGDRLLLCTDGLSSVVDAERIRNVLLRVPGPQRAAEKLVAMANEGGGPDNITVVVLDTADRLGRTGERTGDMEAARTGVIAAGRDGHTGELMTGLHRRVAPAGHGTGSRPQ